MAIDYRDEALRQAFPEISKLGLKVRTQVNSEPWVVNAQDLEKILSIKKPSKLRWILDSKLRWFLQGVFAP